MRSFNNRNDVAFFASFSNFVGGIYVAHVEAGGGGSGPSLVCPTATTVACGDSTDPSVNPDLGVATAADTCTGTPLVVSFTDTTNLTGCGGTGTIVRTWSTTDSGGNTATCDQIIVVVDDVPPVLTTPADTIVECDAIPMPDGVSATDDCDAAPSVNFSEQSSGGCLANATLTRTWTATDACGNTTSASQIITVQDTTPPVAEAALNLLTSGDAEGSSNGDDDEGVFVVVASCADSCAGLAGCPATTLSAAFTCADGQTVNVSPGQIVEIEDESEGTCEFEYENGLLEVEGRVTLTVTCTDPSNNSATATAIPVGISLDNDDETEYDD